MKRSNSSSWKKPFERDIRTSQDSAICSQGIPSSQNQNIELSQVCTQDLFGQISGSQQEQNIPKMSMYEKWLTKRSLSRHNSGDKSMMATPQTTAGPGRMESISNSGGRPRQGQQMNTPSSQEYLMKRTRVDDRDERDLFEQMVKSFNENRNEIKSLSGSLKEMLEGVGRSFGDEAKEFLSSTMEEMIKNHDKLVSHYQQLGQSLSTDRDLDEQLASKNCQIASLETKVTLLENEVKKRPEENINSAIAFQEETRTHQKLMMKKLEEISERLNCQKQYSSESQQNLEDLKESISTTGKQIQTDVQENTSRILKQLKQMPQNVKSCINIKSDVTNCIKNVSAEMEYNLKSNIESMFVDFKGDLPREDKTSSQQMRKQLDKIISKVESMSKEHKMIQGFIDKTMQKYLDQHLKGKHVENKVSDNNDTHIQVMRLTCSQDRQSQHLQSLRDQQKELIERMNKFFTDKENSPPKQNHDMSGSSHAKNQPTTNQHLYLNPAPSQNVDRRLEQASPFNVMMKSYSHPNNADNDVSNYSTFPSQKIYQQSDRNVNNISMPVFNQTNIYPSHTFKSPFDRPDMIRKRADFGASPIAAVRPIRYHQNNQTGLKKIDSDMSASVKNPAIKSNTEIDVFRKTQDEQCEDKIKFKPQLPPANNYWLRKKKPQIYTDSLSLVRSASRKFEENKKPSGPKTKTTASKVRRLEGKEHSECQQETQKQTEKCSIYDFQDDTLTTPLPLRRKNTPSKDIDEHSSPAVSISFDWAHTPASAKIKQRGFPGFPATNGTRRSTNFLLSDMF